MQLSLRTSWRQQANTNLQISGRDCKIDTLVNRYSMISTTLCLSGTSIFIRREEALCLILTSSNKTTIYRLLSCNKLPNIHKEKEVHIWMTFMVKIGAVLTPSNMFWGFVLNIICTVCTSVMNVSLQGSNWFLKL